MVPSTLYDPSVYRALVLVCLAGCGRIGFDERGAEGSLSLTPSAPVVNLGSRVDFEIVGGTPPYTLSLDGAGTLAEQSFRAPSSAGESTIRAIDADGLVAMATVTYRGDALFLVGGIIGGTVVPDVFRSDDGVTWAQIGMLPNPRANGALVVYDDTLFYLGGLDIGQNPTNDIWSSSDGVTWTRFGALPVKNTGFTAIVHAGEIWFVGGATEAGNSGTAFHSSDGLAWNAAPADAPNPRHEHDLISRDGRLFVLGGHGNTGFLDDIVSTTDGTSWTSASQRLGFATDFAGAGELGDRAFRVCGSSCNQAETSTDLVTWTPAANLPNQRESPAVVGFGDRLLVIGGGASVLSTVDGSTWNAIGTLPQTVVRTAAVQFTPR